MWHQPQSLPFLLLVLDCLTVRKAEKEKMKTSLVIQWIRIRLPMQETQVWSLIWEYPTYLGATKPVLLNYWAQTPGAHALQQEKPPQREAPTSQLAKIPPSKGDPAQPKINLKKERKWCHARDCYVQLYDSLFFPTKHPKIRNERDWIYTSGEIFLLKSNYIYISNPASENTFQGNKPNYEKNMQWDVSLLQKNIRYLQFQW